MVCELGGSWDQWERELDLVRLKALQDHQRQFPSVQSMVQGYLGIDVHDEQPDRDLSDDEIEDEIQRMAAMGLLG